jgi:signal transduction histidine kinase
MEGLLSRTLGEHIEISFEFGADTWPALVDPGQLEGALLNLALNGRDAMSAGGKLTIEAKYIELDPENAARYSEVEPGAYVVVSTISTSSSFALSLPACRRGGARPCDPGL